MSDLFIFLMGCLVTVIYGGALAFLIYAETQDNKPPE